MKKILLVIFALVALVVAPAAAFAQPAETAVRESIPAAPFLATAYAFMWLAVVIYVALVARRLSRVNADIDDLKRKLDRDARP